MRMSGLMNLREGEVGDFPLLKRSKSPYGRLGTAGDNTNNGTKQHRRYMLLACLLCAFCFTKAQTIWNKTYYENRPIMVFGSVQSFNDGYIVSGMVADSVSPYFANAMISFIDNEGNLTSFKESTALLEHGIFLNNLIESSNETFVFTGYVIDTVPTLILARYNSAIDTLVVYTYKSI